MYKSRLELVYVLSDETAGGAPGLAELRSWVKNHPEICLSVYTEADGDENEGNWRGSFAACCNRALQESDAEWIQLLHEDAFYDPEKIPELLDLAEKSGENALSLTPMQRKTGQYVKVLPFDERDLVIDLAKGNRRYWNFTLDSFLFRRSSIGELRFRETPGFESEEEFLISYFQKNTKYYITSTKVLLDRFLITDDDSYRPAFRKSWYEDDVRGRLIPLLREHRDSLVWQSGLLFLAERKLYENRNNCNKEILSEADIGSFRESLQEFLQDVSDTVILSECMNQNTALFRVMCLFLLKLKYGGAPCRGRIDEGGTVVLETGGKQLIVDTKEAAAFRIDAINYDRGELLIDGELQNVYWADPDETSVFVMCGNRRIEAERTGIYRFEKIFGRAIWRGFMAQVRLAEEDLKEGSIDFCFRAGGRELPCARLVFRRIQARLTKKYIHSYWMFGSHMLRYGGSEAPNRLLVSPGSRLAQMRQEARLLREIKNKEYRRIRMQYHLQQRRPKKKKIWITYDQLFKGGDNGEYFFRYVSEHHAKDVEMYYLLNEELASKDPSYAETGRLLFANTKDREKQRKRILTALQADIIFSTRATVDAFFDLRKPAARAALGDLYNAQVVCLQHGLTVQKIAQYQNRTYDNLKHYFCASPFERDYLLHPVYGFEEHMLSVTGSPRYDGLTGEPGKQIVLMPTWRRNVTDGPNEKGKRYGYNENFRSSEYFKIYNGLISDAKLRRCAEECGYRILLILHPNIGPQAGDFEGGGPVQVMDGAAVDYEKVMVESALMVTDYSGVRFDFAYMRRPLAFFRPQELAAQYEEGVAAELMEFGPEFTTAGALVDYLCEKMRNGCSPEEEYLQVIDRFFPYRDQKNCRRVYEAACRIETAD